MDIDQILEVMNRHEVAYLLIGGMNFLLRHEPVLTFDVDLWIDDTAANCQRCELALADLKCEWGSGDNDWQRVESFPAGWLERQTIFCMSSPSGAIDIFRHVRGLHAWADCRARAVAAQTERGTPFWSLSDADMLQCQMALPEGERKLDRVRALRAELGEDRDG